MKTNRLTYVKNILIPCLVFSTAAGAGTGLLIFLFKWAASAVIGLSSTVYDAVREHPAYLPLLFLGALVLGLTAAFVLRKVPDCRGGGIPTSIAILRGLVTFHWLKSIVFVFGSAMLTYLCGVPLGNEGPSVQMGTAVGRGIVRKHPAWDRYIMTGGACAGFAAATGSPLTGILFAFEEAHRRFTPMIVLTSATAVIAGSTVMKLLCSLADMEYALFAFPALEELPLPHFWTAAVVGLIVGFAAAVFTLAYRRIRHLVKNTLAGVPFTVKIVSIFLLTACIGFISGECVGSGHHLVDELMEGHGVWYLLIVWFLVRAALLLFANNADVTGGLFVPTLAFGAILGGLCGDILTETGILPAEYYSVMVVIGIASFLGASSRTPFMALAFAAEALCGLSNLLPITIGVTAAYLVVETLGIPEFTEIVVESKAEAEHAGKTAKVINLYLHVAPDSFVVGKEIRDILWPPTCTVLSVHRNPDASHHEPGLCGGDILHVHYQTYNAPATFAALEALVGKQHENVHARVHTGDEHHHVPEV
jgi:H+/Cl- antiporter ClcA